MDVDALAQRLGEKLHYSQDSADEVLPDGRIVIAQVETDDTPASEHINDCDVWGKVSEYAYRYGDQKPRPAGFTGAARKLQVDRGYWMWWEPWVGFLKLSPEEQRTGQEEVRYLLEVGFVGVVVKLKEAIQDSRGGRHFVTVANASLWGIDSLDNNYAVEVLKDLLTEVLDEQPSR